MRQRASKKVCFGKDISAFFGNMLFHSETAYWRRRNVLQIQLNIIRRRESNPDLASQAQKKYLAGWTPAPCSARTIFFRMSASVQQLHQKEKTADSGLFFLVEMMGIEPMSENPLTQLSPWAVCYLDFPVGGANKHAPRQSSPFVHDRFKGERPMHVHR